MRKKGGSFYFIKITMILAIISAGFFCGGKIEAAGVGDVVINEIAWMGTTVSTNDEWIELKNLSGQDIDLSGWQLLDADEDIKIIFGVEDKRKITNKKISTNGFYLLERTDDDSVLGITADFVYTGNLSNDSNIKLESLRLFDEQHNLIDEVFASSGSDSKRWPAGDNTSKKTMERQDNGNWQTSQNVGGTPQAANSAVIVTPPPPVEELEPTPENLPNPLYQEGETAIASTTPNQASYELGDVLINEFISDPADNEVEWIELYNKSGREINLTGWRLEDGGKTKTNLSGSLSATGSNRYRVIEKPGGNLNNSGDLIILYDSNEKIIDQAAYGAWADGNTADNAPAARDPESTARKYDGYNTYNNSNDFAVTLRPTKGASNIIETEDEVSAEAKVKFDFSNDIFITEILPNPDGADAKLEFIEIYNRGAREVDLTGWSLSNEDDKKVNLEKIATTTIIKAGGYLAFFRPRAKIVLHNDKGEVKLYQPLADKPLAVADYKNAKEGWSYNIVDYKIAGEWVWSETITPGAINVFKAINHPPEVEFSFKLPALIGVPMIFDSSDTYDQDDDKLRFSWDFGDGFKNSLADPEHTYLKLGIYKARLEVSDGQATSTKEKSIKIVNSFDEAIDIPDSRLRGPDKIEEVARGGSVIINEIFPNPAGADTGSEWIELINQSELGINLLNWRVENSNGKYEFKSERLLEAGAFYVLNNVQSKLAFKNTSDVINLYNDLDELADQAEYAVAIQGKTYARGANGNWFWTARITPGEENVINLAESEMSIEYQTFGIKKDVNEYVETDLEKVRGLEIGSLVKVKGAVAVPPGILGVQIFYIAGLPARAGSPGIQIYNYKKDFPALRIGNYIEAAGELTQTQGELRIKTKDKNDISLIEYKASPIALDIKADEISEENIGQLIIITGEITDKKSASLYVDDGSDEVFVYIKQSTGIDAKSLVAGQNVLVTGILSKTQTGLRLLPRCQEDIVLINSALGDEPEPQVLGEVAIGREWDLAERDKKSELLKYLLIIAAGIIIALAGLLIKIKRKNQ